jgi:CRISPR-associated protein Csy3
MASDIIPSTLAFSRSIEPSLFAMWGANSASAQATLRPVKIIVETKRGTIANALKPDALEKFVTGSDNSKSPGNANPQSVEAAYLPEGSDTLVLTGQVAFIPNCRAPAMSNGEKFNAAYRAFDECFLVSDGWTALARRYVMNLANARFAWRNKVAAQSITVTLTDSQGTTVTIDSMRIPANSDFDTDAIVGLAPFVVGVAAALGAPRNSPAYVISVSCRIKLGEGAVVYPWQNSCEA